MSGLGESIAAEHYSIGHHEGQEDLIKKILSLKMLTPEQVEQLRKMQ